MTIRIIFNPLSQQDATSQVGHQFIQCQAPGIEDGYRGKDERTRFSRLLHQPQMTRVQRGLAHCKDHLATFLSSWLRSHCSPPPTISISRLNTSYNTIHQQNQNRSSSIAK
jgi:hypothetical protein